MAGADKFWRGADRIALWLDRERNAWAVLGACIAIYAAIALWIGRGTTLFVDEATLFTGDRGFHLYSLLSPLNGHLVFTDRVLYATVFDLWGVDFVLLRLAEIAGASLAAALLFVLLKKRIGAAAALGPVLLLLFLGSTWEANFVLSGIPYVWSVAAGLGALVVLEPGGRRGEIAGATLLLLAVITHSVGLAFIAGAAVLVLLQPDSWRRLWVCLPALVAYVAWFVWLRAVYVPDHGEVSMAHLYNVLRVPNFIADEAATVAGALAGLDTNFEPASSFAVFGSVSPYGPILAVLAVGALIYRLRRPAPPMLWAGLATLLAFWTALALNAGDGRTPTTVRYVYPSAVVVFLIAGAALGSRRSSSRWLVVLFAVTALAMAGNLGRLREGSDFYRNLSTRLRAVLTATEVARANVAPDFEISFFPAIEAGPYLAAVDRVGSPGYTPGELTEQSEHNREAADQTLVAALGMRLTPALPGGLSGCRPLSAATQIPSAGAILRSAVTVQVFARRFADVPSVRLGTLQPGQPALLRIPADSSTLPWRLGTIPAGARVAACRVAGAR